MSIEENLEVMQDIYQKKVLPEIQAGNLELALQYFGDMQCLAIISGKDIIRYRPGKTFLAQLGLLGAYIEKKDKKMVRLCLDYFTAELAQLRLAVKASYVC